MNIPRCFSQFFRTLLWICVATFLTIAAKVANSQSVTLFEHLRDDPTYGPCSINHGMDGVCFYIAANVGADAAPGDYCFRFYTDDGQASGQDACVRVDNNGNWTYVNNDRGLACPAANENVQHISLGLYLEGNPRTLVSRVNVDYGGIECNGEPNNQTIFLPVKIGSGTHPFRDPGQIKDCDDSTGCGASCPASPMASYSIHMLLANLHIQDTPVSYKPPFGPPTDFKVAYNHRDVNQPAALISVTSDQSGPSIGYPT